MTPRSARSGHWQRASRGAGATSQRDSETVQDRLRAWVESKYTHLPLREKDAGPWGGATKLDKLHCEYARSGVHARPLRPLGKIKFAQMLSAVYPGPPAIGPHRNSDSTVSGLFLLRVR